MAERQTEAETRRKTLTDRLSRRSFLGAAAGSLALASVGGLPSVRAASTATTVDLGKEGLQSGDDLTPYLEEFWQAGSEVHIPGGKYKLSSPDALDISAGEDAWLVGDGDVVADHGETHVEFNVESTGDANVRIQNLTLRGVVEDDGDKAKIRVWADDESGLVELVNFNRPDGAAGGAHATGLTVVNPHAGTLRLVNCHIEGFTDNGVYASSFAEGDSNDGMGTLEVYGGLYKNNNVNNIRIGGDDAKVIGAVSVVDAVPNGQEAGYRRGIRVRESGENMVIRDCDLYVADVDGAGPAIQVKDSKFEGPGPSSVTVSNTRIYTDLDDPAIATDSSDFNISAENLQLTGSGDFELQGEGPFDTVTGSSATQARKKERTVSVPK
jgi:hypothetical protein